MTIVTFTIAIIGCITGVVSLILSLYKSFVERANLFVESPQPYLNGFIRNTVKEYPSKYSLIINLRLVNTGRFPLSVKEVYIKPRGHKMHPSRSVPKKLFFTLPNMWRRTYLLPPKKYTPFILEPAAVLDVTFCFRWGDSFHATSPSKVTIFLETFTSTKTLFLDIMDLNVKNIDDYINKLEKRNDGRNPTLEIN